MPGPERLTELVHVWEGQWATGQRHAMASAQLLSPKHQHRAQQLRTHFAQAAKITLESTLSPVRSLQSENVGQVNAPDRFGRKSQGMHFLSQDRGLQKSLVVVRRYVQPCLRSAPVPSKIRAGKGGFGVLTVEGPVCHSVPVLGTVILAGERRQVDIAEGYRLEEAVISQGPENSKKLQGRVRFALEWQQSEGRLRGCAPFNLPLREPDLVSCTVRLQAPPEAAKVVPGGKLEGRRKSLDIEYNLLKVLWPHGLQYTVCFGQSLDHSSVLHACEI